MENEITIKITGSEKNIKTLLKVENVFIKNKGLKIETIEDGIKEEKTQSFQKKLQKKIHKK